MPRVREVMKQELLSFRETLLEKGAPGQGRIDSAAFAGTITTLVPTKLDSLW